MKYTSIKKQLSSGARLNGCWIETFSPICAEIMAMSGYDTAMIDLEHGSGAYLEATSMMRAVQNHGCPPLIRATSANPAVIKRVLDIGPAGIMVPSLSTCAEAEEAVAACLYGPEGCRGAAPGIIRATGYGKNVSGYLEWMRDDFLIIGQVESATAVEQIDDIARVDELDMIFIGPADLSASLGALGTFDSPEFIEAFETVENAVRQRPWSRHLGCGYPAAAKSRGGRRRGDAQGGRLIADERQTRLAIARSLSAATHAPTRWPGSR